MSSVAPKSFVVSPEIVSTLAEMIMLLDLLPC